MDLRQIKQFMALAEEKNFYKAADKIGLTQSALTQAISKLEKELDVQLFIRSKTGSLLTEHGRRLYDHARIIIAQFNAAERELKVHSRQQKHELRFGVVRSLDDSIVMSLIAKFGSRYPALDFKIVKDWSAALAQHLKTGEIDFAFLSDHFLPEDLPEITRQLLFSEKVQVVVGRPHPLFHSSSLSLETVSRHAWVAVSITPDWPEFFVHTFSAANIAPPDHIIKTNSMSLATRLIREGRTIGLVSPRLFQPVNGDISEYRYFDIPELRQERRFSLCYRARMVFRQFHEDFVAQFEKTIFEGIAPKRSEGSVDMERRAPMVTP